MSKLFSSIISLSLNEKSLHFHIPPAKSPLNEPAHPVVELINSTPKKVSLSKLDKKFGSCPKHISFLVEPLNECPFNILISVLDPT